MTIIIVPSVISFMRFLYVWPPKSEEMNPSKWYHIKFTLVLISAFVPVIGSILHLVMISIPNKSLYYAAEDLVIIVAQIGVCHHTTSFVTVQKLAAKLYTRLSTFVPFGKPPGFDDYSRKLNLLAFAYKMNLHLLIVAYFLEPFFTKHLCEEENENREFEDICGLVTPLWMPFNVNDFPRKQFFFLWQIYSVSWTFHSAACVAVMVLLTIEHLLLRIWHLKDMIKEAVESETDELRKKRLKKCVEYHADIYDLGVIIDKVYTRSLFGHILFTGILMAVMGFSTMTVGVSYKTLILFVVWNLALVFASLSAQRLHDYSVSISDDVYNSSWYDTNYEFQKDLMMILRRAQKPMLVHGGAFSTYSHVFLVTIVKSAYTFLTILTTTSK